MRKLFRLLLFFVTIALSTTASANAPTSLERTAPPAPAPEEIRQVWALCGEYFFQVTTYAQGSVFRALAINLVGSDGTIGRLVVDPGLILVVEDDTYDVPRIRIVLRREPTLTGSPYWIIARMSKEQHAIMLSCLP